MEFCCILLALLNFSGCQKDFSLSLLEPAPEDSTADVSQGKPCNGFPELCDKRYDEIVYVTTHNAYNAKNGSPADYLFPNQDYRISTQLRDGVRGLMIDVHPDDGTDPAYSGKPFVYHGFSMTGSEPFVKVLSEIKQFLDTNPREIITIILECYVASAEISASMDEAGLTAYLFTHNAGKPWETLREIIEGGKRLIVFSDVDDAGSFSWYHYIWDYCVETGYSAHSKKKLNCDFNRGSALNSLFILNHFITRSITGTGRPGKAEEINSYHFLINKAKECMKLYGKLPNFLTVDFYSKGNVFDAAKELNGVK